MIKRFSPTAIGRWSTRRPVLAIAGWLTFVVLDPGDRFAFFVLANSGPSRGMPLDRAAWAIHRDLATPGAVRERST